MRKANPNKIALAATTITTKTKHYWHTHINKIGINNDAKVPSTALPPNKRKPQ